MLLVNTMAGAMLTTLLFAVVLFIIEAHKENTRLTNAALEQELYKPHKPRRKNARQTDWRQAYAELPRL